MKLVLHIGNGKTGTTAIQRFLNREAEPLAAQGIRSTGILLDKIRSGFALPHQGAVSEPDVMVRALREIEVAAAALPDIHTILWSNESLAMSHRAKDIAAEVAEFAATTKVFEKVEIWLVLRRQDEWIESAYRQWGLKHKTYVGHHIMSPDEYERAVARLLDYLALFELWQVVGDGAVKVIPYDEVINSCGIEPLFCARLGIPGELAVGRTEAVHQSLGPALSYFNAVYNRGHATQVLPGRFRRIIQDYSLPELSAPNTGFFPTEARARLLASHTPNNNALARLTLGRGALFSSDAVADVNEYASGAEDALTYFALIARQQHDLIADLQKRSREMARHLKGLTDAA